MSFSMAYIMWQFRLFIDCYILGLGDQPKNYTTHVLRLSDATLA